MRDVVRQRLVNRQLAKPITRHAWSDRYTPPCDPGAGLRRGKMGGRPTVRTVLDAALDLGDHLDRLANAKREADDIAGPPFFSRFSLQTPV